MAKKLVGFFGVDRSLPQEEQKRDMVNRVMKQLEEMGVFQEEKENENEQDEK